MGYEVERAATPLGTFQHLWNNLPQLTIYHDFVGAAATNFYRVRSIETNSEGQLLPSDWSKPVEGNAGAFNQEQLLTDVQRTSFDYFYLYAHPVSGLARASVRRDPDICAIGATGMGFFNLGVGIERGFITRQEGADLALKQLKFLSEKADRFHGAFPHFINGKTGKVIPFSRYDDGADIVETAYGRGIVCARIFFADERGRDRNSAIGGQPVAGGGVELVHQPIGSGSGDDLALVAALWVEKEPIYFGIRRMPDCLFAGAGIADAPDKTGKLLERLGSGGVRREQHGVWYPGGVGRLWGCRSAALHDAFFLPGPGPAPDRIPWPELL
jgi:hypothetical protein